MALHGKKSRFYIETAVGTATVKPPALAAVGYTKVQAAHSFKNALSKDLADASVFGDENHLSESGLRGGSLTFAARYTPAIIDILMGVYNSDDTFSALSRPEGDVVGGHQLEANYHIQSLEMGAEVSGLVDVNVTLQRNGVITYSVIA